MKNFIYRVKLFFKGKISYYFLLELTAMDLGRWIFKKAHTCNRCGSPNTHGYYKGLHCDNCINILKNYNKKK